MQRAVLPLRPPCDGGSHAQEWIVRIDRAQRPNLLHVVRAAASHPAHLEDAAQRLKPPQPLIAKMFEQGARVEVEPCLPEVVAEGVDLDLRGKRPGELSAERQDSEGGEEGGKIVFEGTPDKLKKAKTWTGKYMKN